MKTETKSSWIWKDDQCKEYENIKEKLSLITFAHSFYHTFGHVWLNYEYSMWTIRECMQTRSILLVDVETITYV